MFLDSTSASALGTILARFWPALLTEIAVIMLVARAMRSSALGSLGSRLVPGRLDTSGPWCLPLYVWAWQANLFLVEMSASTGLALHQRIYERGLVTIFVSLFYLLALQTIGTMITNDAPATLGMTGHSRTAAAAAMLSVFLDAALFLWLFNAGAAPYALPPRLQ